MKENLSVRHSLVLACVPRLVCRTRVRESSPLIKIGLLLIGLLFTVGTAHAQDKSILSINIQTLKSWTDQSEKVTLVDVGALLVCMDAKIPGALCRPCDEEKVIAWPREGKIVFYAAYGSPDTDCALIGQALSAGLKNVYILEGGLAAWRKAGLPVAFEKRIPRVPAPAVNACKLADWKKSVKNPLVIDIRSPGDYVANHLDGAINIPLAQLHIRYADIPLDRTLLIVDDEGHTGLIAASYLARKGFPEAKRLKGGMAACLRGTR